jgi:uncharacterized protein YndB with AHSA1/START domain
MLYADGVQHSSCGIAQKVIVSGFREVRENEELPMSKNEGVVLERTLHSAGDVGVVRIKARYGAGVEDVWSAISEPARLAGWFGSISGNLHVGGEFTALVLASGWDGQGRIEACVQQQKLRVIMWETEGSEHTAEAELVAEGDHTILKLEVRGVKLEVVWAYGAGWQEHLEDLGSYLLGQNRPDIPAGSGARFQELEPHYRAMSVEPLND